MNYVETFKNEQFGEIRSIRKGEDIYFVAIDVCKALKIRNTTQAVRKLDEDERAMFNIGRQGETNTVNEFGLYNLILSSRKPEARTFKRWVTHEVLPAIRKTGKYQEKEPKPDYDKLGFYEIPMHVNRLIINAVEGCRDAHACFSVMESLLPPKIAAPVKCLVRKYGELMHYYQDCENRALEECGYDNFNRYAGHYSGYLDFCEENKK